MSEMCTINAHSLSIVEAAHVLPHDLLVAETRPPMPFRLCDELLQRAATRRYKKRFASHRIIVCRGLLGAQLVGPGARWLKSIASMLGPMPIEAANTICCLSVGPKAQILLNLLNTGTMGLLVH